MIQFALPHNSNAVKESGGGQALWKLERWLVIDLEQAKEASFETGSDSATGPLAYCHRTRHNYLSISILSPGLGLQIFPP